MDYKQVFSHKFTTIGLSILLVICLAWVVNAQLKLNKANQRKQEAEEYVAKKEEITTPILNSMIPKRTPYWSISYDVNVDGGKTVLKIYSKSPHYRYKAFDYLRKIDPEVALKYQIKFMDYKSEVE